MKLRPSTFRLWWAWLWHKRDAQRRILHRVVCFFPTAATTTVISSPSTSGWRSREKISSMRRRLDPIHCRLHARSVGIWIELSRGLNSIASNPIQFDFSYCNLAINPIRWPACNCTDWSVWSLPAEPRPFVTNSCGRTDLTMHFFHEVFNGNVDI